MCGRGKTSWAIQYINSHPEKSFIYVTPLLNEVDRIIQNCSIDFVEPEFVKGKRKLDHFNTLLSNGCNIATTHATFSNSTPETLLLLQQGDYILILDEVLDAVIPFNDAVDDQAQMVGKGDIQLLKDKKLIGVDEFGRVSWIGPNYQDYKYASVERLARQGNLLLVDGVLFLWEFPVEIFKSFQHVYILTYLFAGSALCPYLQYYEIPFEKKNVILQDGAYNLVPYSGDDADIEGYKGLIEFYREGNDAAYRASALSINWFKSHIKNSVSPETRKLKNQLNNFFRNKYNAKAQDIMWTCPKDFSQYLKGSGYIKLRALTKEENKLPKRDVERLIARLSCFVPCNARATNDFRDRSVLAYCLNLYSNPYIEKFFAKKGILFNKDAFALSGLIQWVWRSCIRDGKPIKLYIPSLRMRTLLGDWLCRDNSKAA